MVEEATSVRTAEDWEKLAGKRKYQVATLHRCVTARRKNLWNLLIAALALLTIVSGAGIIAFSSTWPVSVFAAYIFGSALYTIWHLKKQLKLLQAEIDEIGTWSED